MIRKIICIDENKCIGCGLCAHACQEGAIGMVDGKARLLREDYCDGLGNCLPACPTNAITFVEREAPAFDEAAVRASQQKAAQTAQGGCPGQKIRQFNTREPAEDAPSASQLRQWPCQLRLAPASAPYFAGAELLIAADCTAFAYAAIHRDFMRGRITLIGCPKLDDADYADKLTEILSRNDIRSVTVLRMEVPCCGGLEHAARKAVERSGKHIPLDVTIVSIDGAAAR